MHREPDGWLVCRRPYDAMALAAGDQDVIARFQHDLLLVFDPQARASGEEPAPFWDGWSRLQKEYDRLLPT